MMKKTFVLDTNVLLHDARSIFRFEDNDIVLPIAIIEELDRFKKQPDSIGRNAREVSRSLDKLRRLGNITKGVTLDSGGTLSVQFCDRQTLNNLPQELGVHLADNVILAVALESQQQCQCPVVVVSKDTNLRIKADAIGLKAEDYRTDKVNVEQLYSDVSEIIVSSEEIDRFFESGFLDLDEPLLANQAVTLIDAANPSHTGLAIVDGHHGRLIPLVKVPTYWDFSY